MNVEVAGVNFRGMGKRTWGECVRNDMELFGLQPEWTTSGMCGETSYGANVLTLSLA